MLDAVHNLVQEFKARPPPTDLVTTIPYQIKFKSPPQIKPHRLPSYSIEAEQFMKLEIDNLLAAGKLNEPSLQTFIAFHSLCQKTAPFYRLVINFRPVNRFIDQPNSEFTLSKDFLRDYITQLSFPPMTRNFML